MNTFLGRSSAAAGQVYSAPGIVKPMDSVAKPNLSDRVVKISIPGAPVTEQSVVELARQSYGVRDMINRGVQFGRQLNLGESATIQASKKFLAAGAGMLVSSSTAMARDLSVREEELSYLNYARLSMVEFAGDHPFYAALIAITTGAATLGLIAGSIYVVGLTVYSGKLTLRQWNKNIHVDFELLKNWRQELIANQKNGGRLGPLSAMYEDDSSLFLNISANIERNLAVASAEPNQGQEANDDINLSQVIDPGLALAAVVQPNASANAEQPDQVQPQEQSQPQDSNEPQILGWKTETLLAEGGMGEVYLVKNNIHDDDTPSDLAVIKLPKSGAMRNSRSRMQVIEEAQAYHRLRHENVVGLTGTGLEINPVFYIMLEFLNGGDLKGRIKRNRETGEPFDMNQALLIMLDTFMGLNAVAERGKIHQDIKPENIFVEVPISDNERSKINRYHGEALKTLLDNIAKEDRPIIRTKLGDFGLIEDETDHDGRQKGTPMYMAPEQIVSTYDDVNIDASDDSDSGRYQITLRTDIFSLGVVIYELFTGVHPFVDQDKIKEMKDRGAAAIAIMFHALNDICNRDATPISQLRPDLPPEIARIIMKCINKRPKDRYQSPKEVLKELADYLEAEQIKDFSRTEYARHRTQKFLREFKTRGPFSQ